MRTFTLIWFGQLASALGSTMTFFALTLWAWEQTGSATALALIGFFIQLPQIATNLVGGLIVDRFNRKYLMLLGDAALALATLIVGGLAFTQQLQIRHLYLAVLLVGGFSQIQILAYKASFSLMVPKHQYTRAGSMGAIVQYGSSILGPAVAGALYPLIGLSGIITIDLATFTVAFITLLAAAIPQPDPKSPSLPSKNLLAPLTFGFRQVWQQPNLRALLLITVLFSFAHDLGGTVVNPMILARTDGNALALASVSAAAGIGGVSGAVITTIWGGPKQRIRGMLSGFMGAGLSKLVFGLGRSPSVWVPAQVCSSLNFPLLGSCRGALWMETIPAEYQGRVFAANSIVMQSAIALAVVISGPLADHVLEPAMMPGGALANLFGPIFGNGAGAGMAVLYTLCSLTLFLIGVGGFLSPQLRAIEGAYKPKKEGNSF